MEAEPPAHVQPQPLPQIGIDRDVQVQVHELHSGLDDVHVGVFLEDLHDVSDKLRMNGILRVEDSSDVFGDAVEGAVQLMRLAFFVGAVHLSEHLDGCFPGGSGFDGKLRVACRLDRGSVETAKGHDGADLIVCRVGEIPEGLTDDTCFVECRYQERDT